MVKGVVDVVVGLIDSVARVQPTKLQRTKQCTTAWNVSIILRDLHIISLPILHHMDESRSIEYISFYGRKSVLAPLLPPPLFDGKQEFNQ